LKQQSGKTQSHGNQKNPQYWGFFIIKIFLNLIT
jgi:hypothetical protein